MSGRSVFLAILCGTDGLRRRRGEAVSLIRPLIGTVLGLAAFCVLGGCASAGDAPTSSSHVIDGFTGSTGTGLSGSIASSLKSVPSPTMRPTVSQSAGGTGESATRVTQPPSVTAGSTHLLIPGPPTRPAEVHKTLVGTVAAGVEAGCLILTDETTGRQYNLTGGDKAILKAGARVKVTGVTPTDMMSYCQQGAIFQVLTAAKA